MSVQNNSGRSNSSNFTLTSDAIDPTGGALVVNGVASTSPLPRQDPLRVEIDRKAGPLLTRPRTVQSGTLQDVAMAALFLASTGAAYITGQTLMVNGSGLGGARRSH